MTLRVAQGDDAPSLAALAIEVWLGTYLKQGVNSFFARYVLETYTAANMARFISQADQLVLVSQNVHGIDGFARVAFDAPCPTQGGLNTEIATLYVQPRHHGKGIGRALLGAIVQQCRARGCDDVWLTTNAQNDPAIGFYHANGFTQIGETHFEIGDEGYLNNVYAKSLIDHA